MIHILYTRSDTKLPQWLFDSYLQQLPHKFVTKILKYRKWQDSQRSLLGKMLLLRVLAKAGLNSYALTNLLISPFDRPYFEADFDFNISHSGDYIVCGLNTIGPIGVDVEEMNIVPLDDFTCNFSLREWNTIFNSPDSIEMFYHYWTKKEAFLKAIGIGLNAPLNEVEVIHNTISWEDKVWFLHRIELNDTRHVAHFASTVQEPEVSIQMIDFYQPAS